MERGRDGEREGWREGEMERGRDGERERWREGEKTQMGKGAGVGKGTEQIGETGFREGGDGREKKGVERGGERC